MLVLDGVYVENGYGGLRFHRVKAPSVDELKALVHAISHRVARFLEKGGFLEHDAESSYLAIGWVPRIGLQEVENPACRG